MLSNTETVTAIKTGLLTLAGIGLAAYATSFIRPPPTAAALKPITEDQVVWWDGTENLKPQILAQLNALQAENPECRGSVDLADIEEALSDQHL